MKLSFVVAFVCCVCWAHGQSYNPKILQDTRDLPKVDGRFGFLYQTEDGIQHGAKSNGDGIISGRYTYTDPTGLKVNFNYNVGSRVTPGYNYNEQSPSYQPKTQYEDQPGSSYNPPAEKLYEDRRETYELPQERRSRPSNRNEVYYDDGQYEDTYEQNPQPTYQRRPRPPSRNDLYSN